MKTRFAVAFLLGVSIANAQQPATTTTITQEARDEAKVRFDRGITLFDEKEYERSLVEFERAYALVRSYRILYNIAQVNGELQHYAKAVIAFERFLADGGSEIPPARIEEVQRELANAKARTAKLQVKVNQTGAEITLDDRPFATSPMENAELVDSGQRRVTVRKRDYQETTRTITLAAGDNLNVDIDLEPTVRFEQPSKPAETPPSKTPMYASWGATGAFVAGSVVFGLFALNSASDLDSARKRFGSTESERDDLAGEAKTFATLSTVFGGAAIVTAAVAIYLTVRKPTASSSAQSSVLRWGTF